MDPVKDFFRRHGAAPADPARPGFAGLPDGALAEWAESYAGMSARAALPDGTPLSAGDLATVGRELARMRQELRRRGLPDPEAPRDA